jgi:hypothetical protein
MNDAEHPENLILSKPAVDIVFGYEDGLVNVVKTLNALARDLGIVIPVTIPVRYGARFPTEIYTRGCHWIPRMFA